MKYNKILQLNNLFNILTKEIALKLNPKIISKLENKYYKIDTSIINENILKCYKKKIYQN